MIFKTNTWIGSGAIRQPADEEGKIRTAFREAKAEAHRQNASQNTHTGPLRMVVTWDATDEDFAFALVTTAMLIESNAESLTLEPEALRAWWVNYGIHAYGADSEEPDQEFINRFAPYAIKF